MLKSSKKRPDWSFFTLSQAIPRPLRLCEFVQLPFSVWLCVRSRKLAGRLLRAPRFPKQKNAGHKFTQSKRARYICFCLGLAALFTGLEAQEPKSLSGKLVKRYYPAPHVVKNPAFGWYLELNETSQEVIQKQFQQLPKENQCVLTKLDIDLQTVQCINGSDDILL